MSWYLLKQIKIISYILIKKFKNSPWNIHNGLQEKKKFMITLRKVAKKADNDGNGGE